MVRLVESPTADAYLSTILAGILPRPEVLRIGQEAAGQVLVLTIHLPREDRRYVVGKKGRNIEAIRDLLRAFAGREGRSIVVKLPDDNSISEEDNDKQRRYTLP